MDISIKWTIHTKNNIAGGGIMLPTIDAFDQTVFYLSDGWGTAYSAMRFRKLSIETGEELATILSRDGTRCIDSDKEYIFAILNKRILKLHKNDFSIACTFQKNITRYADYVRFDGGNTLLLMNGGADYLYQFDMQTESRRKKKIGGCGGIFKTEFNTFLVFNYDSILEYTSETNKLDKIADTEGYTECARGRSGNVYILCRESEKQLNRNGEIISYSSKILIYSFVPEIAIKKIAPGELCSHFRLSEDETLLYLFDDNNIWIYSILNDEIVFHHTFQSAKVLNVFTEPSLVITYSKNDKNELAGWEINKSLSNRNSEEGNED